MSIQEHLNKIRNAIYGREVRESIAKGIETAYDDASENGNANMEVKIARGRFPNLRTRLDEVDNELDEVDNKQQQTTAQLAQKVDQVVFNEVSQEMTFMANGKLVDSIDITEATNASLVQSYIDTLVSNNQIEGVTLADNSVTPRRTTFITRGKNLFNPETSESSVALNVLGETQPSESYDTTDYISVNVGDYAVTNARFVSVYDNKKVFLNHVDILPIGNRIVNIAKTGYIRATYAKKDVNRFMIEKGSNYTSYEPYNDFLIEDVKLTEKNIEGVIPFEKTDIAVKKNLFNSETRLIGYIIDEDGEAKETAFSVNYDVSDFIPVDVGTYSITENRNVAIYDQNKNLLEFIQPGGTDERTIEVTQTGFIRVSFLKEHVNQAMVIKGTSIGTTYYSHDDYVLNEQIHIEKNNDEKNNDYVSKKGVHFGDSITASGTLIDKIKSFTGYDIFDAAIGGTRLVDLEATNIYTKLSFCNLLRAITSGDWSVIDNAVDSINNSALTQKVANLKEIDFSTLDYVAFMYGTNDINNNNIALGNSDSSDTTTVNGALNYVLSTLMSEFPNLRVFVFAPIFRPEMPVSDPVQNSDDFSVADIYLYDIANAMGERAKEFKTPFKNMYYESGINKHNSTYYIRDGTHPNDNGDKLLAEVIGNFITTN